MYNYILYTNSFRNSSVFPNDNIIMVHTSTVSTVMYYMSVQHLQNFNHFIVTEGHSAGFLQVKRISLEPSLHKQAYSVTTK